ncbi:MAG TPA: hypothetical protein VGR91_01030 [Stellaceae bacterium]|nr:hypothetical protein [Stellaceae bacterium]
MAVSFSDPEDAFVFVNFGGDGENEAVLDRRTGKIYCRSFFGVRTIFNRKGAYARFKDLLARRRLLDGWHEFSDKAEKAALREWAAENGVELTD